MTGLGRFLGSTIGKKIVMAVSGLVWIGYIVVHMSGNLLAYAGPSAINDWAAFLKSTIPLLWGTRILLVVALVVHIQAAYSLKRLNRLSRPVGYTRVQHPASTLASRTMGWGGVLLLVFLVYHILELTLGVVHPVFSHTNVYGNLVSYLGIWWIGLFYLVAMVALAAHLYHGVWSMFQTVGAVHPRYDRLRRTVATLVAIVVPVGFASIPLAILFGLLR
ncbi:MAG: succinate dehydrogenase cytochrome b subunit [Gemmatimonadetes bacterium]|nr:MAG: succinate dehydrogenase cytochrome b subunit [Gemmatimonadota bacterium]